MTRPVVAAFLVCAAMSLDVLGACLVSVDGLTGGNAGSDAACSSICDGASEGDAPALMDASNDADAAPTCVPVVTPEAALDNDAACGLSDGSTCAPGPLSASDIPWVPPTPHRNACTEQQVEAYYPACFVNYSTCGNADTASCFSCIQGLSTDSTWPALVDYNLGYYYGFANTAGCIATLEPCNLPCAQAQLALDRCAYQSCISTCFEGGGTPGFTALAACVRSAYSRCPCEKLAEAARSCTQEILSRGSPAAVCLSDPSFQGKITSAARVLCGDQ